jgi:hypothetical protein
MRPTYQDEGRPPGSLNSLNKIRKFSSSLANLRCDRSRLYHISNFVSYVLDVVRPRPDSCSGRNKLDSHPFRLRRIPLDSLGPNFIDRQTNVRIISLLLGFDIFCIGSGDSIIELILSLRRGWTSLNMIPKGNVFLSHPDKDGTLKTKTR